MAKLNSGPAGHGDCRRRYGIQRMRLSSLMFSVALATTTLASSAQAEIVTIKVSGTYATGTNASLPENGPVSGEIFVDTTNPKQVSGYTVFDIMAGSYIKFGLDGNSFTFNIFPDGKEQTYLAQSASLNIFSLYSGIDSLDLYFTPPNSTSSTVYSFSSTPVRVEPSLSRNEPAFALAIGGGTPAGSLYRAPTFNLTVTTQVAPGAVPEPASWALMIGGFGLAGATLRRRRSDAAA